MHRVRTVSFMILTGLFSFLVVTANHPGPGCRVASPGETDALRAFDWWYNQRALPQGLIPNNALMKASEELSHMAAKQRDPKPVALARSGQRRRTGPFDCREPQVPEHRLGRFGERRVMEINDGR